MKLQVSEFGIAFGIVYAMVFFLYGVLAALFGWGGEMAAMIGSFYVGFGPTPGGALGRCVVGIRGRLRALRRGGVDLQPAGRLAPEQGKHGSACGIA